MAKLVQNVQPSFKDLDSPEDDRMIVVNDNDEDNEDEKVEEVDTTSNVKTEDASVPNPPSPSSLPTELKESSKFNELTEEVKGLKKLVYELEIKLPGDLKEIPTKLEDFTKMFTKAKLKDLGYFPSLLNKVTNTLNQFAQAIASKKTEDASCHTPPRRKREA
ncbi:hypothetical protein Tco_1006217 [Tanacetum coccineum]|uniref:Uncharacterized protein n=1 Tax=Tanacetum coccineum TaxID=301880 RepID=A0ABQ5FHM9_9ASTR